MSGSSATRFLQQENIRLKKEVEMLSQRLGHLEQYFEMIKRMYWLDRQINSHEAPLELLNQLLEQVISAIGARDGSISLLDETAGELMFVLVHGQLTNRLRGFRIKSDAGIAGWVVENKEPIIVNNPRQDWRFSLRVDEEFGFLTQSIASVPVMGPERLRGVIQLLNKPQPGFSESDIGLLLVLSQMAARVLDRISPAEIMPAGPD